jgi:hypothetical protein
MDRPGLLARGSLPRPLATAALALALIWGAACSSGSPGSGPPAGTYRAAMGSNVLTMRGQEWRLRSGIRVKSGEFRLDGRRIAFIHETANNPAYSGAYCRGERDTYRWSLTGRTLSFRVIGVPCDANLFAVLTVAGPWKPEA